MDWKVELMMAGQAIMAAIAGGFIGWERERHGREAGIRTYAAVCMGSCVFGLASMHLNVSMNLTTADPSRIASNVVTGIGFLGAGVILREKGEIVGLTTAATLWAAAAVGLCISFGMYVLGILTSVILHGLLALHDIPGWGARIADGHDSESSE
jgi:putative Mg2+ transporter-C (MgtC) family protein